MAAGVPWWPPSAGPAEVCGTAALLVRPPPGDRRGLVEVLDDGARAAELRAKGPARAPASAGRGAADRTSKVYEEALG